MSRLPFLLIIAFSGSVLAAPMYEIVDDKGHVTYTDQPPAGKKEGDAKTIEQKPLNVIDPAPGKDYQKSYDQNVQQRQQQRDTAWQQYDSQLREAEKTLKAAQNALKEGKEVKDGDMVGAVANTRGAGVRLSDEYLARQQSLEKAVRDAEANLSALKKQKPKLSR